MLFFFASVVLFLGLFLIITTTIGFIRFRNIYTQIHIASISDMLGLPLILLGMSLLFYEKGETQITIKILFAILIWYIASPISSYCIIKMAYFYGKKNDLKLTTNHETNLK